MYTINIRQINGKQAPCGNASATLGWMICGPANGWQRAVTPYPKIRYELYLCVDIPANDGNGFTGWTGSLRGCSSSRSNLLPRRRMALLKCAVSLQASTWRSCDRLREKEKSRNHFSRHKVRNPMGLRGEAVRNSLRCSRFQLLGGDV